MPKDPSPSQHHHVFVVLTTTTTPSAASANTSTARAPFSFPAASFRLPPPFLGRAAALVWSAAARRRRGNSALALWAPNPSHPTTASNANSRVSSPCSRALSPSTLPLFLLLPLWGFCEPQADLPHSGGLLLLLLLTLRGPSCSLLSTAPQPSYCGPPRHAE